MPRFDARALACLRGTRLVFRDLAFSLSDGGALLLVGPNGSGKSSLLRLLAGLSRPFAGVLSWEGADVAEDAPAHAARLRHVGHLDAVKPSLTVLENLSVWAALDGRPEPRRRSLAALERMGLSSLADVPGRYLSAGQKRRVNLTRLALAPVPLWLLDEPTTALDRAAVDAFAGLVAEHRRTGGMVALSTHTDLLLDAPQVLDLRDFQATEEDGDDPSDEPRGRPLPPHPDGGAA